MTRLSPPPRVTGRPLMVLAPERAHADHDLPALRTDRLGLIGLLVLALAVLVPCR